MTTRLALPNRRNHITQKLKIAGQRTLYISVLDDDRLAEIFLRLKGPVCSSELIGLYDVVARLMSLALQYGAAYLLGAWSRCMSHNPGRPTTNPSGFPPTSNHAALEIEDSFTVRLPGNTFASPCSPPQIRHISAVTSTPNPSSTLETTRMNMM